MGGAIVVVICIIGSMIWGIQAGKKRRHNLEDLARKLGLTFTKEKNTEIADRFAFLNQLAKGDERFADNVISGTFKGYFILAFDYHSVISGVEQAKVSDFSFMTLTLPKDLPELTITKEGLGSKIAQAVGYKDIDFENREFSGRFAVRSNDEAFARAFCTEAMMDFLLQHPSMNIEIEHTTLSLGFNSRLSAHELENQLNQLIELREKIPEALFS